MNILGRLGSNAQILEESEPGEGWLLMLEERPTMEHLAQADGTWALPSGKVLHAEALTALNAAYQSDIDTLNRAHSVAAMAGGSTQASKQVAITLQFNTRKTKYVADLNALRAQYGA